MKQERTSVKILCEAALMLAVAQGLGYLKILELPQGGSVTLAMLPIAVFSWRRGLRAGLLTGFCFGLLQLFLDGAYAWGWQSIIGDYLLAFTPLGLAGIFHGKRGGLPAGTAVGAFGRFLVHWVTGATVWAEYMPDTWANPWVYSLVYNGSYMLFSTLICVAAAFALERPLRRIPL